MGLYQPIDYHRWAPELDFAAWDNYPREYPSAPRTAARMALAHGLMRGLKAGAPFWVMEQTPSITASRDVNPVKRPGILRLWSWQSVAHGADAVLYFQMRQSVGACEKYHGAVLDQVGRTDTRVFREVAALGGEFAALGDALLGARTPARVALLVDWDSWWAVEMTDGLNRHVKYADVLADYHWALWEANASVDVVPGHRRPDRIRRRGGAVAAHDQGRPGAAGERAGRTRRELPDHLPVRAGGRERQRLPHRRSRPVRRPAGSADRGDRLPATRGTQSGDLRRRAGAGASRLRDRRAAGQCGRTCRRGPRHVRGGLLRGRPGNHQGGQGKGSAWYAATALDEDGVTRLVRQVLGERDLLGPLADLAGVEVTERVGVDGDRYLFVLHHGDVAFEVAAPVDGVDLLTSRRLQHGEQLRVAPRDVLVIQVQSGP